MIARWMIVGFLLWFAVAAGFRTGGHLLFQPGADGVSWMFLILPVSLLVVTYLLLKVMGVAGHDRSEAASIMAVPGFLTGLYQISSYQALFPNLDPSLGNQFASLMFACYGAVIIAGIVASRLKSI